MTTREINKVFNLVVTDPKQFSLDYRQNSNTQASNITFPIGAVVLSTLHFRGHRGAGLWTFSQLNITGSVKISDCVNVIIDTDGTVDSWEQESGDAVYKGNTIGDGTTHYKINYGQAMIDATSIDHTVASNYSVIAGSEGVAHVTIEPGALSGLATLFDIRADSGGLIYYAGDLNADGVTFDPASTGRIMDKTGFVVGGQRVKRNVITQFGAETATTVFPGNSDEQIYNVIDFINDTVNRPIFFAQDTFDTSIVKANGGLDISNFAVGSCFKMLMTTSQGGSHIDDEQWLKMVAVFFNSSDVELEKQYGNSNFIGTNNAYYNSGEFVKTDAAMDYIRIGTFSDIENLQLPDGQHNHFAMIGFQLEIITGYA